MATSAMSIHTPRGNRRIHIYINIRHVAILEQLLVRWQLIQAETIETIMVTVFTKSRLDAKI